MSNNTIPISRNDTILLEAANAEQTTIDPDTITTIATTTLAAEGLSGGAIAGIVIGCIIGAILLLLAAFFLYRWLKERRKYHGEYKPHEEEEEHAKNLPYLAPPSVEGLI
ncbi:crb-3 [Pristionchus pacificus]|uniref:Crb-3 n=1 Tax=Pristionchus pacificus TaxID=54126 RepID=A0A454XS64_PRIPA|nr:crb-3 [Pristionchus pacificus]|eukprot:PDM64339.1 crb-3 [Pristionchus pacificus]